ncbi:nuclear transport factor 2 family protein [Amycolatopsis sp. NBC_00355]|uniref:nuclear transport factor 2 family protein n=1 Tax=Amycolatopsis sp. NBC_00355 TaxID=2975957 RepID=UPI002E269191
MPRTASEIAELVRTGMATIDASALSDVFAEDAVYELPFRSERVEGRDAILAALTAGGVRARALGLEKTEVTVTPTESGFVLELVAVGRAFRFPSSVGVVTVVDGAITSYRDYPNVSGASSAARAVFDAFLAASVENRWDDLADLYAEDVVLEMPFTPAGADRFTKGREELRRRFTAAAAVRRIVKADNVVVHETSDPAVLVAEFDLHQEMGGEAFVSTYAMVMTVAGGRITHSRDYADTAASAERIRRFRESSPAGSSGG